MKRRIFLKLAFGTAVTPYLPIPKTTATTNKTPEPEKETREPGKIHSYMGPYKYIVYVDTGLYFICKNTRKSGFMVYAT